jgi:hypothetical protein
MYRYILKQYYIITFNLSNKTPHKTYVVALGLSCTYTSDPNAEETYVLITKFARIYLDRLFSIIVRVSLI